MIIFGLCMRNSRHIFLLLTLAFGLLAASCKSEFEVLLKSNDVDLKYKAAMDYFNKGKYRKASDLFESLSVQTGGTDRDDTVQFYWGKSNYLGKDYYSAETNFTKFIENYPRSPFTDEATFLRLECLYLETLRYELDQTPTRKAVSAINEYVKEYKSDTVRINRCWEMLEDLHCTGSRSCTARAPRGSRRSASRGSGG